jgi:hypothetical protein
MENGLNMVPWSIVPRILDRKADRNSSSIYPCPCIKKGMAYSLLSLADLQSLLLLRDFFFYFAYL